MFSILFIFNQDFFFSKIYKMGGLLKLYRREQLANIFFDEHLS